MWIPSSVMQVVNAAKKVLNLVPPVPVAVLTKEKFKQITEDIVIKKIESGYYHPDMLSHFGADDRAVLAASGETWGGLDRREGGELAMYPQWAQIWAIIDKADARHKWKHYYMGGDLEGPLTDLTSELMYQWFNHLAAKHLQGDSISKIAGDDRLVIHMSYACWNGEGWFKRFARAINIAVGTKDQIFDYSIKARTEAMNINKAGIPTGPNKAIRQQGTNLIYLFKKMNLLRASWPK